MEQKTWWKAIPYAPRMDYLAFQANELAFVLAVEKMLGIEMSAEGGLDADAAPRAQPDPLPPRLARDVRARAGSDLAVLVHVPRARPDSRPVRAGDRGAHAHALLPGRRPRRRHPARVLPAVRGVLPCHARRRRPVRGDARPERDLARADEGRRSALRRGRDRARPVGPGAARLGRRLGPAESGAVPRLRRRRVRRPREGERRRLGSLQGAHGRDARVGAHRRADPRGHAARARGSRTTARSCCRRARSCTRRWSP